MGTDNFKPEFITSLIRVFPEIDLRDIFTEEEGSSAASEPKPFYGLNDDNLDKELKIIGDKVANVRSYLAQNRHNK